MTKGLRIALVTAVIFSSGLAAGHSLSGLRAKALRRDGVGRQDGERHGVAASQSLGPMGHRLEFLRRAQKELELTPEQRLRVQTHLNASQERIRKMWEPMEPQFRSEMDLLKEKLRGEMTPAQVKKLDRILKGRNRRGEVPERSAER